MQVKTFCKECKKWNHNKFPMAKVLDMPRECTVYKGLGRTPHDYCSKGDKDGSKTSD